MNYRPLHAGLFVVAMLAAGSAVANDTLSWKCESKWGKDDQIGNMNHITPEKTLQAAKLITKGKSYRLGIEVNSKTPAFPPRFFSISILQPNQAQSGSLGPTKLTYNDDIIMGWNGVGPQIDGLGHIGVDGVYYNCLKAADFAKADGLKKLGIETVPAIATRGIVLDMVALYGKDGVVPEGTPFNQPEIEAAMKRQGIKSIDKGDIVIFHTNWNSLIGKDDKRYGSVEPGLGVGGAKYLVSRGVAAVGSDSWGLEVLPFEKDSGVFEVHQILMPLNGVFILENLYTAELVKDQAWEFFFTLGPARMTGAVQAIINPIGVR